MITEFDLIDADGNIVADGEIDGGRYRVFSDRLPGGYQEFETLTDMFTACKGTAIQPALFPTPPRARQLQI